MRSPRLRSSVVRVMVAVACAVLASSGCGGAKTPSSHALDVPTTPIVMTGHAQVSGLVRDGSGNAVSGATIAIAETDGSTTSDPTGAYTLMVPSDSTLTLVTSATGFATTFHESIILAEGVTATGFDVMLLPTADVARLNALGPAGQAATTGLVAVRLHSMNPACTTAGAHVSIWPPLAAAVLYARPSTTGGLDEPDPALSGVEAGAHVDAWLAAAVPPGNLFQVRVDQPGCALAAQAPSQGGVLLTGQRRVDVQALTEFDLFLE